MGIESMHVDFNCKKDYTTTAQVPHQQSQMTQQLELYLYWQCCLDGKDMLSI
jgi:hypothetical protein